MTLVLQNTEIDPESMYVLDGCCDDDVIDAAASMALRLYGDRTTVRTIIENAPVQPRLGLFGWRTIMGQRLTDYADTLIAELNSAQQGMLFGLGLVHMRHVVRSGADYLSYTAMVDCVEGGASEAYNYPPRSKNGVDPYKKDWRRLCSPAWIRRYVKRDTECLRWRALANRVLARGRHLPRSAMSADRLVFDALMKEQRARINERTAVEMARLRQGVALGLTAQEAIQSDLVNVRLKPKYRKLLKKRRTVIKRAVRTAVSVLGHDLVAAFGRGEPVMIVGEHAAFQVEKTESLASTGHGAIDLMLCDKDSREPLARLCFYIEKTPALDQLTALGLHVATGDELEIVKIANVTSVLKAGIGHPLVGDRLPLTMRAVEDAIADRTFVREHRSLHDLRRERNNAYLDATLPTWLDAIGVRILGHRANKLSIELTGVH